MEDDNNLVSVIVLQKGNEEKKWQIKMIRKTVLPFPSFPSFRLIVSYFWFYFQFSPKIKWK